MVEGLEVTTGSPEGSTKYILSDADSLESHSVWGVCPCEPPFFLYLSDFLDCLILQHP